jgi:hypothetical protein
MHLAMEPDHVERFSPDSFSITEFNAQEDIDIAEKLYSHYSLLGESVVKAWNFPLLSVEFNMTHQSAMFRYSGKGCYTFENGRVSILETIY